MTLLDNVHKIELYFRFGLIPNDEDDNKFVDVALSSNAHFLVSNDRHFQVLKSLDYPKVNLVSLNEFKLILEGGTQS